MLDTEKEATRLKALHLLDILDSGPEAAFDGITRLASKIFGVPIAVVSLVDEKRQWFKSCVGLDVCGTDRDIAFCDVAIRRDEVMVVADATRDPRFSANPLVTGEPHIRFYAGAPLRFMDNRIGTLCIIDRVPRAGFSAEDASRLQDMADTVSAILHMRKDAITNKAALDAQVESRTKLELMEKLASVGYWTVDLVKNKVTWSRGVYAIHGVEKTYRPDLATGIDWYHPEDRPKVAQIIETAVETGKPFTFQMRLIRADGEERTVVSKGSVKRDADGKAEAIFGVFTDITDSVAAQRKLEASEAHLRLLADNVPGMVGYWDADLNCRFANNAYFEWFNRRPEDLLGMNMREALGEDLYRINEPLLTRALDGEKQMFERAVTKPSGEVGSVLVQYVPDRGDDGAIKGFYVLATDVTVLKRKEQALEQANTELVVARQQAEAAADAKAQFLATMSHEIRTPLTSIIGYSGLIKEDHAAESDTGRYGRRIHSAGHSLLGLINDVLDHAKLDSGKLSLEVAPSNVSEIVADVVDLMSVQSTTKHINLLSDIDPHMPPLLMVDEMRLRQVLQNLIGNAIKFTSQGGVRVAVNYSAERLRISVTDTGIGISPEGQALLFQKFSQVDRKPGQVLSGTGLGLMICKQLVELMGGDISVQSQLNAGSTFTLDIPAMNARALPGLDTTVANPGRQDCRVLIVEDNASNRDLMVALLSPLGYQIVTAEDGAEAVQTCLTQAFDVILMDVNMPVMDGYLATAGIRSSSQDNALTPIIALTAGGEDVMKACLWSGMNDYLAKPIQPSVLVPMLDYWIEKRAPMREQARA